MFRQTDVLFFLVFLDYSYSSFGSKYTELIKTEIWRKLEGTAAKKL